MYRHLWRQNYAARPILQACFMVRNMHLASTLCRELEKTGNISYLYKKGMLLIEWLLAREFVALICKSHQKLSILPIKMVVSAVSPTEWKSIPPVQFYLQRKLNFLYEVTDTINSHYIFTHLYFPMYSCCANRTQVWSLNFQQQKLQLSVILGNGSRAMNSEYSTIRSLSET